MIPFGVVGSAHHYVPPPFTALHGGLTASRSGTTYTTTIDTQGFSSVAVLILASRGLYTPTYYPIQGVSIGDTPLSVYYASSGDTSGWACTASSNNLPPVFGPQTLRVFTQNDQLNPSNFIVEVVGFNEPITPAAHVIAGHWGWPATMTIPAATPGDTALLAVTSGSRHLASEDGDLMPLSPSLPVTKGASLAVSTSGLTFTSHNINKVNDLAIGFGVIYRPVLS